MLLSKLLLKFRFVPENNFLRSQDKKLLANNAWIMVSILDGIKTIEHKKQYIFSYKSVKNLE